MDILAFERDNPDVLEETLETIFPGADLNINTMFSIIPLKYGNEEDLVITQMKLPVDYPTEHDLQNAGLSAMIYCRNQGIPAVCMTSKRKYNAGLTFPKDVLERAGVRMVNNVDKSAPEGWTRGLQDSFSMDINNWTKRPGPSIRSPIQEILMGDF